MDNQQYYLLLYDMALASSGETAVLPLLTKTLQRLLYHTGFPCGLYLHAEDEGQGLPHITYRVERAICGRDKAFERQGYLQLPREELRSAVERGEAMQRYDALLPAGHPYRLALQLPVHGDGLFLLLAPGEFARELPFTQLFEPILANFSKNIRLCRHNEARARQLEEEVEKHRTTLQALQASEANLKKAQQLGQIGHWLLGLDDTEPFWSEEVYRILGLDPRHFTPTADSLWQLVHHEDRPSVPTWGQLLTSGEPFEGSHRIVRPDGEARHVHEKSELVRDAQGKPIYLHGTIQDITEQRLAEEEREQLRHQLQQSQKMESIGHLTGGIAHDFNNILAAVLGYTDLLRQQLPPLPNQARLLQYLDAIQGGGERARELVKQMLAFSRRHEDKRQVINPAPVVKEAFKLLRSTIPSSITCSLQLESGDDTIYVDPVQLHQIVMNLVINARDAMEGKGQIQIALRPAKVAHLCSSCHTPFQGHFLELRIRDGGRGIPPRELGRIFDPFYTTKEVGKGTGLGLSVVHGIVHASGGHLFVDSTPGAGTTFSLYFPLTSAVERGLEASTEAPTRAPDNEHILVVDDEAAVADMLGEMLRAYGYRATTYTDSREALAHFSHAPYEFDLVLSDQTMPGLTGLDMLGEMLAIRPELPTLLCSGYSAEASPEVAARRGIRGYLAKPIEQRVLFTALAEALSE